MVANLTVGKKGYEEASEEMKEVALRAQELKDALLQAVDDDTRAFNMVMEAFRLPKSSEDQAREKEAAVETASRQATLVPLSVLEKCASLLDLAATAAQKGNRNSLSDAGVAAAAAEAAATGAFYNVRINLPGIRDENFKQEISEKAAELMKKIVQAGAEARALVQKALGKG
jgi:formiminotetrahydrofolate cyclodeaminase